jgi:DNA-binding NtrC family response regulator
VSTLEYPGQSSEESELERRIQQLVLIARALSSEVETLQKELGPVTLDRATPVKLDDNGIDFYQEIERYEIDLIRSALDRCGGNQTHAARLLHMKSTTLNAKMKHYGLQKL